MKSKWFLISLTAISVVLCGLAIYKNTVLTKLLIAKDVKIQNLTNANVTLAPQFDLGIKNCGQTINEDMIELRDADGNKVSLKSLFEKNEYLLIYRYSDNYCQQCVDYALYNLRKVGCKNVIFIGNCSKGEKISEQMKEYGLSNCVVLNCSNMNIHAEKLQFPYYMVIDKSLKISGIYMPNKASYNQNIDSLNLDLMYRRFVLNDL
jgi:hypothetical protein